MGLRVLQSPTIELLIRRLRGPTRFWHDECRSIARICSLLLTAREARPPPTEGYFHSPRTGAWQRACSALCAWDPDVRGSPASCVSPAPYRQGSSRRNAGAYGASPFQALLDCCHAQPRSRASGESNQLLDTGSALHGSKSLSTRAHDVRHAFLATAGFRYLWV